jgi:hypothetical protein
MLGTLGFTAAAVAFLAYGITAHKIAKGADFNRDDYLYSYILTALGCLVWAAAVLAGHNTLAFVIVGDALLLVASAYLLNTLFSRKLTLPYILAGTLLLYVLLTIRLTGGGAEPIIRDGILIFNTPRLFGFLLGVLLLVVWVQSNMNFYRKVIDKKLPGLLRSAYFSANILGFISVISFLMARHDLTIITAFGLLVSTFALMAGLNYYVGSLPIRKVVKHAK